MESRPPSPPPDDEVVEVFSTAPVSAMLVRDDTTFSRAVEERQFRTVVIVDAWRGEWNNPVQVPGHRPLPESNVCHVRSLAAASSAGSVAAGAAGNVKGRSTKLDRAVAAAVAASSAPTSPKAPRFVRPSRFVQLDAIKRSCRRMGATYDADSDDEAFLGELNRRQPSPKRSTSKNKSQARRQQPNGTTTAVAPLSSSPGSGSPGGSGSSGVGSVTIAVFELVMELLERSAHHRWARQRYAPTGSVQQRYDHGRASSDENESDDDEEDEAEAEAELEDEEEEETSEQQETDLGHDASKRWSVSRAGLVRVARQSKLSMVLVSRIYDYWRRLHARPDTGPLLRCYQQPTLRDRLSWYNLQHRDIAKRLRVSLESLRLACDLVLKRERYKQMLTRVNRDVVEMCWKDYTKRNRSAPYSSPFDALDVQVEPDWGDIGGPHVPLVALTPARRQAADAARIARLESKRLYRERTASAFTKKRLRRHSDDDDGDSDDDSDDDATRKYKKKKKKKKTTTTTTDAATKKNKKSIKKKKSKVETRGRKPKPRPLRPDGRIERRGRPRKRPLTPPPPPAPTSTSASTPKSKAKAKAPSPTKVKHGHAAVAAAAAAATPSAKRRAAINAAAAVTLQANITATTTAERPAKKKVKKTKATSSPTAERARKRARLDHTLISTDSTVLATANGVRHSSARRTRASPHDNDDQRNDEENPSNCTVQ